MECTTDIPKLLNHLPVFAGFPVPYFVHWNDGKPDFRVIDPERVMACVNDHLCGICGKKLVQFGFFVCGPVSKKNLLFSDPAMHESCAKFAAKVCPFLNETKPQHSDRSVECPYRRSELVITGRPETMYLVKAATKTIGWAQVEGEMHITCKMWSFKKLPARVTHSASIRDNSSAVT